MLKKILVGTLSSLLSLSCATVNRGEGLALSAADRLLDTVEKHLDEQYAYELYRAKYKGDSREIIKVHEFWGATYVILSDATRALALARIPGNSERHFGCLKRTLALLQDILEAHKTPFASQIVNQIKKLPYAKEASEC